MKSPAVRSETFLYIDEGINRNRLIVKAVVGTFQ